MTIVSCQVRMTYSFANTVGLGLTGLDGVVALGDAVVKFSTANHFDDIEVEDRIERIVYKAVKRLCEEVQV